MKTRKWLIIGIIMTLIALIGAIVFIDIVTYHSDIFEPFYRDYSNNLITILIALGKALLITTEILLLSGGIAILIIYYSE